MERGAIGTQVHPARRRAAPRRTVERARAVRCGVPPTAPHPDRRPAGPEARPSATALVVADAPVGAVVPVVADAATDVARADALADALGAPHLARDAWAAGAGGPVVLWVDAQGLGLRGPAQARAAAVRPTPPPAGGRPGREPLLRAVGVGDEVIDATAGWGVDAGVLAAAGRRVTMIERHPVLAALLRDALARWRAEGRPGAERLVLLEGDARTLLGDLRADVVLLDPMYPERGKAARKGEDLVLARRLVGDDPDQGDLLAAACAAARRRVVVKRPRTAPPLAGRTPTGGIEGRTTRFDLYPPSEAST
jgi:16S rRNA (guanine1516-N2)-methyltransferase